MNTWWLTFQDELEKIICEWCHSSDEIYDLEGQKICRKCLESNEIDEQPSLFDTNEERELDI